MFYIFTLTIRYIYIYILKIPTDLKIGAQPERDNKGWRSVSLYLVQWTEQWSRQKRRQRSSLLLRGRIDSIPWHASYFAPGWFEEFDELHQDDMKNRMNCIRTIWRIGWIALIRYAEQDEFIPFFKSSSYLYEESFKWELVSGACSGQPNLEWRWPGTCHLKCILTRWKLFLCFKSRKFFMYIICVHLSKYSYVYCRYESFLYTIALWSRIDIHSTSNSNSNCINNWINI